MKTLRLFITTAVILAVGQALALTDNDWNGSLSGRWADGDNWSLGHKPTTDEAARFSVNYAGPVTVTVDTDETIGSLILYYGTIDPDPVPITLTGTGSITSSDGIVCEPRHLIIDGVTYRHSNKQTFIQHPRTVIEIKSGEFSPGGWYRLQSNSFFHQNGGIASFYPFSLNATNATLRVSGGIYNLVSAGNDSCLATMMANNNFDFCGGRIVKSTIDPVNNASLMPRSGVIFDDRGLGGASAWKMTDPSGRIDAEFGGTLFLTNKSNAALCTTVDCVFYGRGSYYAQWFYPINDTGGTVDFDLARFALKGLFYSNGKATVNFRNGVEFGAWGGDMSMNVTPAAINVYGDAVFNTTDAFDDTTARSIALNPVTLKPHASLTVKGAGTTTLKGLRTPDPLESVSLAAGTKLVFTDMTYVPIISDAFSLGAGSTVTLTPGKPVLESAKLPTLGAGGKLSVAVGGLIAGNCYAVYSCDTADDADPLPAVELTGVTGTWQVKRLGGLLYLEDATAPVQFADDNAWLLSPADANWSNPANWKNGTASPASSGSMVYFGKSATCAINNDVKGLTVSGLMFGYSEAVTTSGKKPASPYVFSGEPMTLASSSDYVLSCAVANWSPMPVVIENEVTGSGSKFLVYVNEKTFVGFKNRLSVPNLLSICGDVRLSGATTCADLRIGKAVSGRDPALAVLDGGSLDVSAQGTTWTEDAALRIAGGGRASFNGGTLTLNNAPTRAHHVDGRLSIHALANMTEQTFSGTGRLDIAASATVSGGAGKAYLAHGLTCVLGGNWETASAADAAAMSVIALDKFERATLAADADWTYGPAAGAAPTSTAADRALALGAHSELTVRAADPDTLEARTITFADPIIGETALLKIESGTLAFAAPGTTVGEFRFEGGAINLSGALKTAAQEGLTDVLTAKKITGDVVFAEGIKGKVITNDDGTMTLCAKKLQVGLVIIFN